MAAAGQAPATATLAVIDDHPLMRVGIIDTLLGDGGFRLVGEGSTAASAIRIATEQHPDVMLLDLGMPGDGFAALKGVRRASPATHCIMLTVSDEPRHALDCLRAGAHGYVLKGIGALELRAAVRRVLSGESFVSPEFATRVVAAAQGMRAQSAGKPGTPPEQSAEQLSPRERQVIAGLEQGLTNKQIAAELQLSERTVKHYMSSLMQRFGATNRVGVLIAWRRQRDMLGDLR
ncbi:response regulator [Acidimangrovimonas sediminis]|uniref:response regulator n=1 Tax=Acidimangrovimonas sediminis TaxID=2056283 RepID=UPI000C7FADC0|nr:response regulator transcription factor [Acidimangrovimonas sediminis]